MLAAYGIPTVADAHRRRREDEAVACAEQIGYPVVLKLYSETITHKTDVGGVQLNLRGRRGGARAPIAAIEQSVAREGRAPSTSRA